jgi:hypothetical protein
MKGLKIVFYRSIFLLACTSVSLAGSNKVVVTNDAAGIAVQRGANYVSDPVFPVTNYADMRTLPPLRAWQPGDPIRELPRQFFPPSVENPVPINPVASAIDPLQKAQQAATQAANRAFTTPIASFDSLSNPAVRPMDPVLDVSPTHIVLAINSGAGATGLQVFNKDGTAAAPPVAFTSLAPGCDSESDPYVLWDRLANRWVLMEIGTGSRLCVYVSADANPITTTWRLYTFTFAGTPDYPQIGVWNDSYLVGINNRDVAGQRPLVALDRDKMLAGQPATLQRFNVPNLSAFGFQLIPPADYVGGTPPAAGTPGMFIRQRDDEAHNAGSNNPTQDFLELWQLSLNWTTPASSVLTGPQSIQIADFSSDINGFRAFEAFPQPNGIKLDPVREIPMRRVSYRRFANYESVVGNFVTDVDGQDTGGIRWFELRRSTLGTGPFALHQEGTFAPDTTTPADRWMGAIAQDEAGNLALGYSITRQTPAIFPSLRYTGRLSNSPLGTMSQPETEIVSGTASQTNSTRWGDYFDMVTDPTPGNDCQFWMIGSYIPAVNAPRTRVSSFRFDQCGPPRFVTAATNDVQAVCAATATPVNLSPVSLDIQAFNGFTGTANVTLGTLPTGFTGTLTQASVVVPGSTTANISVNNTAAPGLNTINVNSVSGAQTETTPIRISVTTIPAAASTLSAPANSATNIALRPTLTWTAVPQVSNYVVEVARDAAFATIVFQQTVVSGTSVVLPTNLSSNTQHFWRVRTSNVCPLPLAVGQLLADGFENPKPSQISSPVFSFTTIPGPGDCAAGQTATVVFTDNMESGAPGWTNGVVSGTNTWALSTAFPASPVTAYRGNANDNVGDQYLETPTIAVPTLGATKSLVFNQRVDMEPNAANCYDGGQLQVSVAGGAFTQVTAGITGLPYTGALGGGAGAAWCNTTPYTLTAVDLAPYAGQSVKFRFRLVSDINTIQPDGWNIDDVRVQTCN